MSEALLQQYCDEVLRFRKALNLTSISSRDEFMERFVKPSVAMAKWMPGRGRLLDIGSGMGVPGIPLLIACPGLTGVLVERRKKRAEFLRHVIRKLQLQAEVYDADVNALPHLGVDVCVARAVTSVAPLLQMCGRHANPGAVAVLPVPRDADPADVPGWKFLDKALIRAVESQQIHRYGIEEPQRGDVSRET